MEMSEVKIFNHLTLYAISIYLDRLMTLIYSELQNISKTILKHQTYICF